ncbi:MAG: hypothetical protein EXS38_03040 [Opitutus sp.]|nr:hypothetical protein [Opitutus sp.]
MTALLLGAGLAGRLWAAETEATVITSRSLEMHSSDTETTSIFDGQVQVTATGLRLTCDHLEVVSARLGEKDDTVGKQDRFTSLVAVGHVRLVQGDREAVCERAEVRPREDSITLTGNPAVTDRGNGTMATGDPLIMMRRERRVRGTNVKITAPPLKDLGYDQKLPPPLPDGSATAKPK